MGTKWKRHDRDCWVVDYRDATGKRKRLTAATREDADALLAEKTKEVKKALQQGDQTYSTYWDYTLEQYAEVFLDRARLELEEKTWRSYRHNLQHHIIPALGKLLVRQIGVSHISRFLTEKRKARFGVKPGHEGKPYSRTAIRLMKAALSSLLTDAVDPDGLLTENPALSINRRKKRHRSTAGEEDVNAMTTKQRDTFLVHALIREQGGLLPHQIRVMWELRVKTGLRPEEAYALHIGDVNLEAKTIRIERAVSLGQLKPTKTGQTRYVDLSTALCATLSQYLDFVRAEGVAAGLAEPYGLFPGRNGGLVTEADERWHRDLFKHVLQDAKLPSFTPYDLRHTFASLLLSRNVPILYVSKQLGHKKPTTTMKHYATWLPEEDQRFVDLLDTQLEKLGTKGWHQVDIMIADDSQPIEKIVGGVSGGNYGPLIKSQRVRCCRATYQTRRSSFL